MNAPVILRITVDPASRAWISEITRCLSVLGELVPKPVEIFELVRGLPDRSAAFYTKSFPTDRAGEHRLVLEPCQGFRDLVAAMRAREGLGEFVDELECEVSP